MKTTVIRVLESFSDTQVSDIGELKNRGKIGDEFSCCTQVSDTLQLRDCWQPERCIQTWVDFVTLTKLLPGDVQALT